MTEETKRFQGGVDVYHQNLQNFSEAAAVLGFRIVLAAVILGAALVLAAVIS